MKRIPLLLSFFFAFSAFAQHANRNASGSRNLASKLDAYLVSAVKAHKFNGNALIAKGNEIILHKSYGPKNVAAGTANDRNTRFPILSITKSFTAIVLLKLQEEGKLSLKDPVNKYLPDFPKGDQLTLENLLIHNSGMHNYTDDIGEEDSALVNHPVDRKLVLDLIYNRPFYFEPGKEVRYNNSAYYLAGLVIEKVTGNSYEQAVRNYIFKPLKMTQSGFDFNGLSANVRATGYQFLNAKQQKPYTYLDSTVSYAAGSIYSTTGDMYKWVKAIAGKQLLNERSWMAAFTPVAGDFGLGFMIGKYNDKKYIKHSGGYPGFVSEFIYFPDDDVRIILLKNSGNYGQDIWPVTMGLSNIVFGQPYDVWKVRKEVKLDSVALARVAGRYGSKEQSFYFFIRDNNLYMDINGQAELLLLAESENTFYFENFNTQFRFMKSKGEKFDALIIHEHGKDSGKINRMD
jgi:CubicO group peptidase (beta-lactamase class C family)